MNGIGDSDDVVTARGRLNNDHTVPSITHEQDKALQAFGFGFADGNGDVLSAELTMGDVSQ
jgi:hypothetical protein